MVWFFSWLIVALAVTFLIVILINLLGLGRGKLSMGSAVTKVELIGLALICVALAGFFWNGGTLLLPQRSAWAVPQLWIGLAGLGLAFGTSWAKDVRARWRARGTSETERRP